EAEGVEVRQLGEVVLGEDEGGEVREVGGEGGLDGGQPVAGEEEGLEARREGEVGEGEDVIVGEVDGVLGLVWWAG
ncbi:MAG: hypothetical protein LQ340_007058, partial [Diploschistes diacapsis]